jgi:group I intron endonuclease
MTSGIYWLHQISRDRAVYVGSTNNMSRRWSQHRYTLTRGVTHNKYLQRVWNKYGAADFQFMVLEECPVEQLIEREQFWANALDPACNVGEFVENPTRGRVPSAETRLKMSAAKKGKKAPPRDPDVYRRIGLAQRGKVIPQEQREKISATKRGRKLSAEHIEKLKGHPHPQSPETRQKISQAMQGNKRGLGNKSNTGKTLPEAQRQKMSEAQRRRYARKE